MGPKRYARSIWCGITVFFAVCTLRCYQAAQYVPPPRIRPDGSIGVRCGMGAMAALFAAMICVVLALISLLVFVSRKKDGRG